MTLLAITSIAETPNEPDSEASPRLLRLARELQAAEGQSIINFWKELDGKAPSDEFADFLANELVPWARKTYRVHGDPVHTIVGGCSLGGKIAVYCGLKHSEVFGKVLSQSGTLLTAPRQESPTSLWEGEAPGLFAVEFVRSPRLPLQFYLEAGRYETTLPFSPLLETRRLRDALEAKGYHVAYSEFVGDHNEVCWRGSFADAIMALTAKP